MDIPRPRYLDRLIDRRENGMVKVITGIRRCGKSWLLFSQYYRYLRNDGVEDSHIIRIALDDERWAEFTDRKKLGDYIRSRIVDQDCYYVFLDDIQRVAGFEKVLNGLGRLENVDIYVTGSSARFLSTDIRTEFRGRGDEVRLFPLSFAEFCTATGSSGQAAWAEYSTYGGLPQVVLMETEKDSYLMRLCSSFLADLVKRHSLRGENGLTALVNVSRAAASSVGALVSPARLACLLGRTKGRAVTDKTISRYLDSFCTAFLLEKAGRYDIKGRKTLSTPAKYYYCDPGLRNGMLSFRQSLEAPLQENVLYNELRSRGCSVDVGMVRHDEKGCDGRFHRRQLNVDFVAVMGNRRYYVQSACALPDAESLRQECAALVHIPDSFRKLIVVGGNHPVYRTEDGITVMGLYKFLMNDKSLDI